MLTVTRDRVLPTAITGSYAQPGVVKHRLTRGPLEYTALWKVAQRLTDKPVKLGAICAPALAGMLGDEHSRDDRALINDLCDIMNAEVSLGFSPRLTLPARSRDPAARGYGRGAGLDGRGGGRSWQARCPGIAAGSGRARHISERRATA